MRLFLAKRNAATSAASVAAIFVAQRELWKACKRRVLPDCGCPPEIAEILIELHLANRSDDDGFIAFRDLLSAVDYTPALLSRRITWLRDKKWAQTRRVSPDATRGIHGNCQTVRITKAGRAVAEPIWRQFEILAADLLAGLPASDLAAHERVIRRICDALGSHRPAFAVIEPQPKATAPATPPPLIRESIIAQTEQEFLD